MLNDHIQTRMVSGAAQSIGEIAFDVLSKSGQGDVFGSTSQGVFLRSASRWLIFLSVEGFRSPLTITLADKKTLKASAQPGMPVSLAATQIMIPEAGITIDLRAHELWRPAAPRSTPAQRAGWCQRASYFAEEASRCKPQVDFSALLPVLLALPSAKSGDIFGERLHPLTPRPSPSGRGESSAARWGEGKYSEYPLRICNSKTNAIDPKLVPIDRQIERLQRALHDRAFSSIGEIVSDLLGLGEGLTPSGDDFILGLLLSLNRWQATDWSQENLANLNQQVVETAYQRTTQLSANLIECAALGQGDERLIKALDWLICGGSQADRIITDLLSWGNSSGVAALAGMVVALMTTDY